MLIALTGTPGTGKTSVAEFLQKRKLKTINLNQLAEKKNFVTGLDTNRKSKIIDISKLEYFIEKKYTDKDEIIILESHISHLLQNIDKVFLLRCHPEQLKKRLKKKGWNKKKIKENLEAEILDVILCETLEIHAEENVFEINTSEKTIEENADTILNVIENDFQQDTELDVGQVDWSEEVLKDF